MLTILGKIVAHRKSIDTSDFLASDTEEHDKQKKKKPKKKLKDLLHKEKPKESKDRSPIDKAKASNSRAQGNVIVHDNEDGPVCYKCGTVCKDMANLKNHVLSHFYHEFSPHLPSSKPFPCPECGKENRDRITLTRHYAFTHQKIFELTEVTPDKFAASGQSRSPRKPKIVKPSGPSEAKVKQAPASKHKHLSKEIVDTDGSDDDEDFLRLLQRANKVLNNELASTKSKEKKPLHREEEQEKKKHKHKNRDREREYDKKKVGIQIPKQ